MRRRRSAGPRRGAAGWLAILILTLASIFVGWLVVRTSAADALIKRRPAHAAVVAPRDPRIPISLAMLEFRAAAGTVRPETRKAAIDALERAPLEDEPFFFAAMEALVQGEDSRALELLHEVRRRNPRSRFARLILLDRYLRLGRIDEATGEMTALNNLITGAGGILIPELGRLARSPQTGRALEAALRRNPEPRDMLLEHLAQTGADPELILRLARNVPAPRGPGTGRAWQGKLVDGLISRGDFNRAYAFWRTFSAPQAPARKVGLYDPEMRGLPGLPPFNWHFPATPAGAAERSNGTLTVEFYGRDSAMLAEQLLVLSPGRYRLLFIAEGSADGESSKLAWRIQCAPRATELGAIMLTKVAYSPKRITGEFTVPASGCPAQRLQLVGHAAEFVKPQNVTIRGLQLAGAR